VRSERILLCAVLTLAVMPGNSTRAESPSQEQDAGPLEQRATPATAQNPVPRLTRAVMPQSPDPAPPIVVALRVTLDEHGRVGEVRPLGPGSEKYSFYVSRSIGGEVLAFTPVTDRMPPRPGGYDAFADASMKAVRQWQYEPPQTAPITFNVVLGFEPFSGARLLSNGVTGDAVAISSPVAAQTDDPPGDWTAGAVRVSGGAAPRKVKDVAVNFPPIAQSARVQGVVTIDARIEQAVGVHADRSQRPAGASDHGNYGGVPFASMSG
jgi:hypothetical protein